MLIISKKYVPFSVCNKQIGGDDMDAPIKRMLSSSTASFSFDEDDEVGDKNGRKNENHLCGVNSYNIGRPLVQMVHFIYTYLRVVEEIGVEPGDENTLVDIILPTGAMGNIAGGYMAKKMGLPIGKLCAGVNINDITHRVIESGQFHKVSVFLFAYLLNNPSLCIFSILTP